MMDTIIPDVLHHVCSFLQPEDARKLRLVSRKFADIGACYSHTTISFTLHEDDLRRLVKISHHPFIRKNVRTLVYRCVELPREPLQVDDYNTCCLESYRKKYSCPFLRLKLAEDSPELASKNNGFHPFYESLPHDLILSDAFLDESYCTYQRRHTQQEEMFKEGKDHDFLNTLTSRLPALKKIDIDPGEWYPGYYCHHDLWAKEGVFIAKSSATPLGCRQLGSLLSAIRTTDIKLDSLVTRRLDWRFFETHRATWTGSMGAWAGIKRLKLHMDPGDREQQTPDGDALQLCSLGEFLSQMQKLERLEIIFCHLCGWYDISMGHILRTTPRWTSLTELRLWKIRCERQDLMKMLDLHKSTLKTIEFAYLDLQTTSWTQLLPAMRDTLQLKAAFIVQPLRGVNEETAVPETLNTIGVSNPGGDEISGYLTRGWAFPDFFDGWPGW